MPHAWSSSCTRSLCGDFNNVYIIQLSFWVTSSLPQHQWVEFVYDWLFNLFQFDSLSLFWGNLIFCSTFKNCIFVLIFYDKCWYLYICIWYLYVTYIQVWLGITKCTIFPYMGRQTVLKLQWAFIFSLTRFVRILNK